MKRDSLSQLIARSFGLTDVIQPVLPSRFEPIGRIPFPGAADFESNESPVIGETASPGIRPAVAEVQATIPTAHPEFHPPRTLGAEIVTGRAAVTDRDTAMPAHASRRPAEAHRGSVLSPGGLTGVPPPDEASDDEPRYSDHSPAPIPADAGAAFAREKVAPRFGSRGPLARPPEKERNSREISPAEIRIREPETAEPSTRTKPQAQRVLRSAAGPTEQQVSQEQKVTVHIGRIEVRAVLAQASEPGRKHPVDNRQRLTLSDYLKQREKGAK